MEKEGGTIDGAETQTEYIPAIFESLGYDPEILGIARMYSLASNVRKCAAEGREFTSGYANRDTSHGGAGGNPTPDTSAMQHELTYLRQQVEFLKKLPNWAEGQSGGADDEKVGQGVRVDPRNRQQRGNCSIRQTNPYRRMAEAIRTNTVADNLLNFIQILKDSSLRQSMSRIGNCWDNAPQESFFGHMKDEIDLSDCETFDQVKAVIDDWIDYYNNDRYQWQLAKLSQNEFYHYLVSGIYPLLDNIIRCKP